MDAKELGNQAAHPWIRHGSERGVEWKESEPGMTLRQHFAGLAMQGLIAHETSCASTAADAVAYADALLQELAKET